MNDLFTSANGQKIEQYQPLAERARPKTLDDFFGQTQILGKGLLISEYLKKDRVPSFIVWGPPGSGKTTLARLISLSTKSVFVSRSAIDTGAKDLKSEGEEAKNRLYRFGEKTILFIDEIHRLNKAQQDCLLPYVETGVLTLIGATTENPSFEINSALLSRCQLIVFGRLDNEAIEKILERGKEILDENLSWKLFSNFELKKEIVKRASGDGRRALNLLENIYSYFVSLGRTLLTENQIEEALTSIPSQYDKSGERHYDTVSAFIKSIRGSDPHAALYYMAVMLRGGESPLFLARRLVVLASEDIGNADPRAIQIAVAIKDAIDFVGMPEGAICLAQAVTYLATCPKSNSSYLGLRKAQVLASHFPNPEIPLSIRNAPTKMMEKLGYGGDYNYAHDSESGITPQKFMPENILGEKLYSPTQRGHEKNISAYLQWADSIVTSQQQDKN